MTTSSKAYLIAVIALGAGVLWVAFADWHCASPTRFGIYLFLALLSGTLKIRMPGMRGTYSMLFLFVLIGVAEFSLAETITLACSASVVQTFWRTEEPPRPIHAVFNFANIANSVAAAYLAAHGASAQLLVRLAIAAVVYYLVNTLLVSGILTLVDARPLLHVWREWFRWSLSYYAVGVVVCAAMLIVDRYLGWEFSLLVLPAMYLEHIFYRYRVRTHRAIRAA